MQTYPTGTRIGQYEVASRPMMGGMGVVYFALDHGNDGHPVALKTFRPELLPDRAARDRFLREGTAWIELGSHPHIVRCYKVEYIDPTAFLVLELIAKEQNMPDASLRSWLIPGQPLPLEQALLFALQIARGMQYATERIHGFVHRDLKPENILVSADKLPGTNINRLRVTDFGLVKTIASGDMPAKVSKEEELKPNQVQFTRGVGTPLYMAPEQWKGERVSVYTDVYAFGCILYEMVSGEFAVKGKTFRELQTSHCQGKLQPMPSTISEELKLVLRNCLATDPTPRFENWDLVINSIEAIYRQQNSRPAPNMSITTQFGREEQIQIGWSYNALGLAYRDIGKADLSIDYFEKALFSARDNHNRAGEAAAMGNLGLEYLTLGDARQAMWYFEQRLNIAGDLGDRSGEAFALGYLGSAWVSFGDPKRAIEHYEHGLAITREIGDSREEGNALGNIGIAYWYLKDYERAVEYYEQQIDILRRIGDRRAQSVAFGNLAAAYINMGQVTDAIEFLHLQLQYAREIGDRHGEGTATGNLGSAYLALGDLPRALAYFEYALPIRRELGAVVLVATTLYNMAIIHAQQGNVTRALPFASEAAQILIELGHPNAQPVQEFLEQLLHVDTGASMNIGQEDDVESAFEALRLATSRQDVRYLVEKYTFMADPRMIEAIEYFIAEKIPNELKPAFEQRLDWLKQIAKK